MKHDMKYLELKLKHAKEMYEFYWFEGPFSLNPKMYKDYWRKVNYWAGRIKMYTRLINELKNHGTNSGCENGL